MVEGGGGPVGGKRAGAKEALFGQRDRGPARMSRGRGTRGLAGFGLLGRLGEK
jgi:hypothetical protein